MIRIAFFLYVCVQYSLYKQWGEVRWFSYQYLITRVDDLVVQYGMLVTPIVFGWLSYTWAHISKMWEIGVRIFVEIQSSARAAQYSFDTFVLPRVCIGTLVQQSRLSALFLLLLWIFSPQLSRFELSGFDKPILHSHLKFLGWYIDRYEIVTKAELF